MQPGGHRFDPGQLHQRSSVDRTETDEMELDGPLSFMIMGLIVTLLIVTLGVVICYGGRSIRRLLAPTERSSQSDQGPGPT